MYCVPHHTALLQCRLRSDVLCAAPYCSVPHYCMQKYGVLHCAACAALCDAQCFVLSAVPSWCTLRCFSACTACAACTAALLVLHVLHVLLHYLYCMCCAVLTCPGLCCAAPLPPATAAPPAAAPHELGLSSPLSLPPFLSLISLARTCLLARSVTRTHRHTHSHRHHCDCTPPPPFSSCARIAFLTLCVHLRLAMH